MLAALYFTHSLQMAACTVLQICNTTICIRGVARISARGFPKSLGNKGAGEGCATRARILEYANTSIVTWPAFSSSLHFAQCASALRKACRGRRGGFGTKLRKSSQLTFDRIMLVPRTPNAEHHSIASAQRCITHQTYGQ